MQICAYSPKFANIKKGIVFKMTTSIARQSVIIKCNMQKSHILGNYEYYYGAGVAAKVFGFEIPEDILPSELAELLVKELADVQTANAQEAHLISILKEYDPEKRYDEQMKELLLWGKEETCLWQVSISH